MKSVYAGKTVLVTGGSGFKGTWLVRKLREAGAQVLDYDLQGGDDILDVRNLRGTVHSFDPDFVFHLAAQAFVPVGYEDPVGTFQTNTMGTVNVLDAVRLRAKPCNVVVVTTDKCYAPGHVGAYYEGSPLGGRCPYSASKAAAEHAVTAYQLGYFAPDHVIRVATARGGNVIGPGDWGKGRLIPNAVRALKVGRPVPVFNKNAVRPWQFVEDVIDGYMMLGAALDGPAGPRYVGGWNFGPDLHYTVPQVVERLIHHWGYGSWEFVQTELREAEHLEIDSTDARERLGWRPKFNLDEALEATVRWYKHEEVPA